MHLLHETHIIYIYTTYVRRCPKKSHVAETGKMRCVFFFGVAVLMMTYTVLEHHLRAPKSQRRAMNGMQFTVFTLW